MHDIMASLAEYYSANLSTEAKKGHGPKAKNGGTHGVAPIGYLNSVERIAGRDVKTVVIDDDRAHHVIWAYEAYTTGEWSISRGQLLDGAHTPLVSDGVWFKVQDLLAERRLRGDRSWRHTHHLRPAIH